jgi:DNA-directed RNA polymerase specialized sigma24 family protein
LELKSKEHDMTEIQGRAEKLLAQILLLQLKESSLTEKALYLSRAGFESSEIAELMGASAASISQQLYAARKSTAKKPAKRSSRK